MNQLLIDTTLSLLPHPQNEFRVQRIMHSLILDGCKGRRLTHREFALLRDDKISAASKLPSPIFGEIEIRSYAHSLFSSGYRRIGYLP